MAEILNKNSDSNSLHAESKSQNFECKNNKDLLTEEYDILVRHPELLDILLKDRTLSTDKQEANIFWATDNYAHLGEGYQYDDKISLTAITGENSNIIVPRALKSREQQQNRSRKMAEVFTPSWVCNKQANMVDSCWFGREDVFNTEIDDEEEIQRLGLPGHKQHSWIVNPAPIAFPQEKTWREYVCDNRLEITCGEAPYLISRYDTVTGEYIPVSRRIGLLDRKLRVVGENCKSLEEWQDAAEDAFKSTYGYEWQGDNIILARKAMFFTYLDYFHTLFDKEPSLETLQKIAYIVSWNIWQMDGLKCVIPNSCKSTPIEMDVPMFGFDDTSKPKQKYSECPGCKTKNMHLHNGLKSKIMDWGLNQPIEFVSLYPRQ